MAKKISCGLLVLLVLAGVGVFGGWSWLQGQIKPMPAGEPFYVRYDDTTALGVVFRRLQERSVVRNADALRYYARLQKNTSPVSPGTYQVHAGMTAEEIFKALRQPVRQMVRMPETNWAARSANILEKNGVTTAVEYLALVHQPQEFKDVVDFPLPKESLEGYLYPDTYDFPPLYGARNVIKRQLRAFQEKVYEPLGKPKDIHRLVTIGSMVELEVMKDEERPMVAGVIENRTKIGMPLQIDASLLYGIQKWRRLTLDDYKTIDSPYNLYTHKGLPPGPICSPSYVSVKAAKNPAHHNFLYYVAMPGGNHMFSPSYGQHLANIQKRRAAMKAVAAQGVPTS